jgi:hypothetical protein
MIPTGRRININQKLQHLSHLRPREQGTDDTYWDVRGGSNKQHEKMKQQGGS